jgi:isopentenyl-diphosphate delta-isomerase
VILVDEFDNTLGTMEKMKAHVDGELHRAFSVFIFNGRDELMLQQRALTKYHSPGLWTNTCCSHPREGEETVDAAHRRMKEEMGFDCDFREAFSFTYEADVGDGLTEHEFDHVFIGRSEQSPSINREEVNDWTWKPMEVIRREMETAPEKYTVWFRIAFEEVDRHLKQLDNS